MRLVIANTTLLNGGDAAINEATMLILRRALGEGVEFACYDSSPDVAARYHPEVALRPALFDQIAARARARPMRLLLLAYVLAIARIARHRPAALRALPAALRESLREYRAAAAVISAGGTYLVSRYRLAPRIFDFLVVQALGRPLVLFTQSIGPLSPGRDRFLLARTLRRAALVMVRDQRSAGEVEALGVPPERIACCADAAFALARGAVGAAPAERPRANPPHIAVSVRDWPFLAESDPAGMDRYINAVARFVRRSIEADNARVTMLSTCQGIPEYWTDDSAVARQVVDRLPAGLRDAVTLDTSYRTPEEMIACLKRFDLVVATRMHAAIMALCAGVPVVAIAYEFKTRELFASLDATALLCDIGSVTAGRLYRASRRALRLARFAPASPFWRRVALASGNAIASGRLVAGALTPRVSP